MSRWWTSSYLLCISCARFEGVDCGEDVGFSTIYLMCVLWSIKWQILSPHSQLRYPSSGRERVVRAWQILRGSPSPKYQVCVSHPLQANALTYSITQSFVTNFKTLPTYCILTRPGSMTQPLIKVPISILHQNHQLLTIGSLALDRFEIYEYGLETYYCKCVEREREIQLCANEQCGKLTTFILGCLKGKTLE